MGAARVIQPASVRSSSSSSSTLCSSVDTSGVASSSSLPLQSCSLSSRSRRNLGLRAATSEAECAFSRSRLVQSVRRPVLRRAQDTQQEPSFKTLAVEDEGVEVEGVIKVEKERTARPSWGRVLVLAGGDLLALLAFASIGRANHGSSPLSWDIFRTADPFIAGWLLGAYFLGGFGPEGQGLYGLRGATFSAIKSWGVSIPLGLVIRTLITGHTPPQTFILISMGSTFVLLVSWRTLFTALFPNEDTSRDTSVKKGSILEFFELLTSLVRRW
ncbi:uncharacterized protein LOC9656762 [Selaginella moellendorffii]|uniref:uncharacterized protein LOC9656762 n=1 Tax=Selaginella moellendorffii TaxID=88036 RepID=UPI000D1C7F8C|nr:uncharacterized protein LOC9656762 [Selaginella moellendorffii]|eukprot:XP_002988031.2 uncharacterized protein LOC9656762 [Selaginella moellendorffii]